jgi:hypothetical protein
LPQQGFTPLTRGYLHVRSIRKHRGQLNWDGTERQQCARFQSLH